MAKGKVRRQLTKTDMIQENRDLETIFLEAVASDRHEKVSA
jgi:hypothetical protein